MPTTTTEDGGYVVTRREYLGVERGYCDGAIQTYDTNGRGFCTDHAKERGF